MRIILSGSGSFIARAVAQACRSRGADYLGLRHDDPIDGKAGADDCVINFALDPQYRSGEYHEEQDRDLAAARAATRAGAHFLMLSTRRVYPAAVRWRAAEATDATGDETAYGRNKARTEKAVRETCGDAAAIFRLSNIFGYEYNHPVPRRSFLGQMLYALKLQNTIFFDMHPDTRRDFLPVEICAGLLVDRALDRSAGTFNLGGGFPIPCGDLAEWIMQGFGGGKLVSDPAIVRDEFFLSMEKWRAHFGPLPIDVATLQNYCFELGERLKCEKS